MSKNNNRLPKKRVAKKKVAGRTIDITDGNAPVLTIKFLNAIHQELIAIKELLKHG